ncbi:hypothetical protein [Streptomyces sp. NBC_00483]|uniref:hypothetical protein n=1 Tax=Streptomyces sp. NBC_00483 TaxID=2975756 RepID=UPI002E175E37
MSALSDEAGVLLAAVLEAIDLPHPATVGDTEGHDKVLNDRVMHLVVALKSIRDNPRQDVEWTLDYLRERLAEHPTDGYRAWGEPS